MERFDIFKDIAERTGGDIYLGVVGPVRSGKSTFIKRFMDLLVLPKIQDANVRERTKDELPQSGTGRTIMTTEPKFIPDDAIAIQIQNLSLRVRLVDCVGYTVPGARGYEEDSVPRMVLTPWFDEPIPFQQAAEIGTKKVITEHSTIGLVVTTDGSITDIPRQDYVQAEERVIRELKELSKPFIILLNSTHPFSSATRDLARELTEKYGVNVVPVDCLQMGDEDAIEILHKVLYEFPLREVNIRLSRWVDALDSNHWLRERAYSSVYEIIDKIERIKDVEKIVNELSGLDFSEGAVLHKAELGTGIVDIELKAKEELFYKVLAELTGLVIEGNHHLVQHLKEMSAIKRKYEKVARALEEVEENGYGVVVPSVDDIVFEEPERFRQGPRVGVKLKASAPSIHMIKTNINTEVTPFLGTEKQGEEMLRYLSEEFESNPEKIWNSDFLGKPLHELIQEGIQSKLQRIPENAHLKLQETLTKIVNEGSGGLICIIL
ncbi:MAG: stage IV sporulation protein A [Firmicutes bacterium]|nr:stage IV sporulation protein A [Bacillota bacterium]